MYRKDFADGSYHIVVFDRYGSTTATYNKHGVQTSSGDGDPSDWGCSKQEYINQLLQDGYMVCN